MRQAKSIIPSAPREYLSAAEVAALTPFSVKALELKRYKGEGPKWYRIGRKVLYRWSDIVSWIEGGSK